MSKPLVSVVTAYHNRTNNLRCSLESVLRQSYSNIEFIIVDDCSTDDTYAQLEEISDPRLKLFRNTENLGFTRSIIRAIAQSTGKYIAIHGAGDISLPSRIERLVDRMEADSAIGLVGSRVENYCSESGEITPVASRKEDGSFNFTHGEIMMRRSVYDRVGGYYSWCVYGQFSGLKRRIEKISDVVAVDHLLYRRFLFREGVSQNEKKLFAQSYFVALTQELDRLSGDDYDFEKYLPQVNIKQVLLSCMVRGLKNRRRILVDENFELSIKNNSRMLFFLYKTILHKKSCFTLNLVSIRALRRINLAISG